MSWKNVWHAWGNAEAYALLKAGNELNIENFVTYALREIDNFYPYCYEQGFFSEFFVMMEDDSIQNSWSRKNTLKLHMVYHQ